MSDCLFCKIVEKKIPADVVYEDEHMLIFKDIHPKAPVHLLVIPKIHCENIDDLSDADALTVGKIFLKIKTIAQKAGLSAGYRVITNNGVEGGQEVYHLHFHVLGGGGHLPGF